jgi:peptide/nickel transport system permease protein
VAEVIFSIPGVGSYMLTAINNRDYPAVRGGVFIIAVCFCLIMLIVDIIYAVVDPRIREQYES